MVASTIRLVVGYVLLVAILPTLLYAASFAALYAIDPITSPGFTLILGSVSAVIALVIVAVITYSRAKRLDERGRRVVTIVLLSSILWAYPVASRSALVILVAVSKLNIPGMPRLGPPEIAPPNNSLERSRER